MLRIRPDSEKANAISLVVQVEKYVEQDGQVMVQGRTLPEGESVTVGLTTKGNRAANSKRPTLAAFRDHKVYQKDNIGCDPGGIIGFNGAFKPNGSEHWVASWPNLLAQNTEEAKGVRPNVMATLETFSAKRDNAEKKFGIVSIWQLKAIKPAANGEEVEAIAREYNDALNARGMGRGMVVIRALNNANEVVGYTVHSTKFNSEEKRNESGAEFVARMKDSGYYKAVFQSPEATRFEVIPAARLPVSDLGMTDKPEAWEGMSKAFVEGPHLVAKRCAYAMDGEQRFITKFIVHDPYGPGMDPVLLTMDGQPLSYSAAYQAELDRQAGAVDRGAEPEAQTGGDIPPGADGFETPFGADAPAGP